MHINMPANQMNIFYRSLFHSVILSQKIFQLSNNLSYNNINTEHTVEYHLQNYILYIYMSLK